LRKLNTTCRELLTSTSHRLGSLVTRASQTSRFAKASFLSTAIVPVLFAFHGGSIVDSPVTAPPPVAVTAVVAPSTVVSTIQPSTSTSEVSVSDHLLLAGDDEHALTGDTLTGVVHPVRRFAIIPPDPSPPVSEAESRVASVEVPVSPEQPAKQTETLAATSVAPAPDTSRPVLASRSSRTSLHPFIASAVEPAQRSQAATGVPASVTIAQAILESDWGKSGLAVRGQNYFGIKASKGPGPAGIITMNTWEVMNGKNVTVSAGFRKYNNMEESFTDHGRFLADGARYAKAMSVKHDARAFARAIHAAGYATDPAYSTKLINIMQKYDLFEFDLPAK
jgi:flagellum-specific peptidoglycan hydrolase FlgJ